MTDAVVLKMNTEPQQEDLRKEALSIRDVANGLVVDSDQAYEFAIALRGDVRALGKKIDLRYDPMIAAAHASHKIACDTKKLDRDPVDYADKEIGKKLVAYANKKQLEAEAVRAKAQAEAQQREEAVRLAEAAALEDQGHELEALAILSAPIQAAPVVVETVPEVEGFGLRDNWVAVVTDKLAFVRAAIERPDLLAMLEVKQSDINKLAKAHKQFLNVAGLKAVNNRIPTQKK